jgi:hypothetical protein
MMEKIAWACPVRCARWHGKVFPHKKLLPSPDDSTRPGWLAFDTWYLAAFNKLFQSAKIFNDGLLRSA